MLKRIIISGSLLFALLSTKVEAQTDITDFFEMGHENASVFVGNYLAPMGIALGSNMNSGWYNTAQAHRLGRFDFRIGIPTTFVNSTERYFTFIESDYQNVTLVNSEDNLVPTIFGENRPGPAVSYQGAEFQLPSGTGVNAFPVIPPSLQFNLGLIKDTEVMFRFVPETTINDFTTSTMGFGIKHGIKQHIPGIRYLPFDLSLIMAWSQFNALYGLSYNPQNSPDVDTDAQNLDVQARAYNINLVVSKKLSVITFHGGLRYMHSDTDFLVMGGYPMPNGGPSLSENPISVNKTHGQVGMAGGFRLKLGFFSIFADGVLSDYSSVNAGISLGFHN
jgi:hypothetical protein